MNCSDSLIASLDVGTTTIRCLIFDKNGSVRGQCKKNVKVYFPDKGHVEINHNELWNTCIHVIKEAVHDTGLDFKAIVGLGISCQRNSFITWKKSKKQPYHNVITWKDIRANDIVNELNGYIKFKVIKLLSKIAYAFTRNKRYLAGSILKIENNQIAPRLLWVLRNIPEILEDLNKNDVAFGTIDTWLLHKLSDGFLHVTDISSASSTGLFDPFTLCWAEWAFKIFKIPQKIFPEVVDNAGSHFGCVSKEIFGEPIQIYSCMADQSASMYGFCCFNQGDIKVTMGTGTFLDINTGNKPHASFYGLYPLVGWKYLNELVYIAEGSSNDTGSLIQFAQECELINDPTDCSQIAQSVGDNNSVYFVPAFNGLQAPINDPKAAAGFIGLKSTTRKPHLLRAILESIVFRVLQLFNILKIEAHYSPLFIRVDGGVSNCDFILQLLSNVTKTRVHRPSLTEMSALGAAFSAGLVAGFWESKNELINLEKNFHEFSPQGESKAYEEEFVLWSEAIKRFLNWHLWQKK